MADRYYKLYGKDIPLGKMPKGIRRGMFKHAPCVLIEEADDFVDLHWLSVPGREVTIEEIGSVPEQAKKIQKKTFDKMTNPNFTE